MTKSKVANIKGRRKGALERLQVSFDLTKKALSAYKDLKSSEAKALEKKSNKQSKEIANLEAKKNFSRKNK